MKRDVLWTCSHCERDHRWVWDEHDVYDTDNILMVCDMCELETRCIMRCQPDGSCIATKRAE